MEIKKPAAPPSLILEQQCKNLRINGAILGHLQAINSLKHLDYVVAMDWVSDITGMVGYMYLLIDVGHIYFAKRVGILKLPKALKDFAKFKTTLDLLFAYQHTILNLAVEAQSAIEQRQVLDQICETIDIEDEIEACSYHYIFFTPNPTKSDLYLPFYSPL